MTEIIQKSNKKPISIKISSISTGFIEVPGQISLNIFTQGCKIRCKGCQNKDLWNFSEGTDIFEEDLIKILEKRELPTWICWLGGEPTDQPDTFKAFNKLIKGYSRPYKVALYTGRQLNDILPLLDDVDFVVDGPWEGLSIYHKGTNQRVYLKIDNEWKNVKIEDVKDYIEGKSVCI